jgi:hypothetical protein
LRSVVDISELGCVQRAPCERNRFFGRCVVECLFRRSARVTDRAFRLADHRRFAEVIREFTER